MTMKVEVIKNVFESNDTYAQKNRQQFKDKHVFAVNIISSPGAGKTSVLERLIPLMKEQIKVAVIEGDLYTTKDADRIEHLGVEVVQINTEGACHLDAKMITQAAGRINLEETDLLIIENVGNLVCPAEFDVGENMKIHIASIAEGNDKPMKYPLIYEKAQLVLLNKVDLIPYTEFDLAAYKEDLQNINPKLVCLTVSARTGEGIKEVAQWLIEKVKRQNEGAGSL